MDELKTEQAIEGGPGDDAERLGIRHIMYWMVGIALAMGVLQVRDRLNDQTVSGVAIVAQLAFAGAYGLGLAGLMVCLRRLRRKQQLLRHPGYGWLFLMGIAAAIDLGTNPSLLWIHSALFPVESGSPDFPLWYLDSGRVMFGWFVGAGVAFAFSFQRHSGIIWRMTFVAMGIFAIHTALTCLLLILSLSVQAGPGSWILRSHQLLNRGWLRLCLTAGDDGVLVIAIFSDLVQRKSRDWLHWCGVFPWMSLSGLIAYDLVRVLW